MPGDLGWSTGRSTMLKMLEAKGWLSFDREIGLLGNGRLQIEDVREVLGDIPYMPPKSPPAPPPAVPPPPPSVPPPKGAWLLPIDRDGPSRQYTEYKAQPGYHFGREMDQYRRVGRAA